MDLKTILADPHEAISRYHTQVSSSAQQGFPGRDEIVALVDALLEIKQQIKAVREAKGRCAGQFKQAKGNAERVAVLKGEMQKVSTRLAELESERKQKEALLLSIFNTESPSAENTEQRLPAQFNSAPSDPTTCSRSLRIVLVDDNGVRAWDDYVNNHPRASAYHHYRWRRVIRDSFSHPCFYLAAKDQHDQMVGVLPVVWLRSRLFGSFGVSLPFFNYGGPLADSIQIAKTLLKQAAELAIARQWQHLEVRTTTEQFDWPETSRKVSMIRHLPESTGVFERDIGSKVRAQVKQGASHKPVIDFGGKEYLDDFYKVFSVNMRDLGTPVYSKAFFANILREFPQETTIARVRLEGRPVAAAFLLGHREMMEIPWASTLKNVNHLNINMWMYYRILNHAIDRQYAFFDFGRSSVDAGTYRFKRQWGARPVNHHWYYWLADNAGMPELNPDNPQYKLLIGAWRRLPVWVSRILGPQVVKNLP